MGRSFILGIVISVRSPWLGSQICPLNLLNGHVVILFYTYLFLYPNTQAALRFSLRNISELGKFSMNRCIAGKSTENKGLSTQSLMVLSLRWDIFEVPLHTHTFLTVKCFLTSTKFTSQSRTDTTLGKRGKVFPSKCNNKMQAHLFQNLTKSTSNQDKSEEI